MKIKKLNSQYYRIEKSGQAVNLTKKEILKVIKEYLKDFLLN